MRLRQPQVEAVSYALDLVPARLKHLAGFDLFCGDPLFAGVLDRNRAEHWLLSGNYQACVAPSTSTPDNRTTLVAPGEMPVPTALHEIGHVIHFNMFERTEWRRLWTGLTPATDYARTDAFECFAEAFMAWFYPPRQLDEEGWSLGESRRNREFFDRLCAW